MVRLRGDLVPKWAQPRPSVEDQVAILEPEDASSFAAFEGFSYRPGAGSAAPPGASGRLGAPRISSAPSVAPSAPYPEKEPEGSRSI